MTSTQTHLLEVILAFTLFFNPVVPDGISRECLDCLQMVQPMTEDECIHHPTLPEVSLCGAFKLSRDFYVDCSLAENLIENSTSWATFAGCYRSIECSRLCVEAYHNRYTETCAKNIAVLGGPLSCADYAQIHFGGPYSCGIADLKAVDKIDMMVSVCGCPTVYDNATCSTPMPETTTGNLDTVSRADTAESISSNQNGGFTRARNNYYREYNKYDNSATSTQMCYLQTIILVILNLIL